MLRKLLAHKILQFLSEIGKTHPMFVMQLVVREPFENRRRRQLFPTPETNNKKGFMRKKIKEFVHSASLLEFLCP